MTEIRISHWVSDTQSISNYSAPHLNLKFASLFWESMTHQGALTTQFCVATLGLKIPDVKNYVYVNTVITFNIRWRDVADHYS